MNIRPLALAAAIAGSAASPLFAASQIEEEVVVTATRSPYALARAPVRIRVITADDIARSAARSVEELLRSEGSLQVRDGLGNGRFVSVAARGLAGGQNTLILVDGRRLNNADLSEPDLTVIDLADVERVEVLEGGAGVLFGDQAVGGVVNVITRQGREPGGRVELGVGSYQNRHGGLSYGGTAGALDYRLSTRREKGDGYRDDTDVDYGNLRGELGYTYGRGRLFVEAQSTDNDFRLPGALYAQDQAADRRQAGDSYNDYRIDSDFYRLGVDDRLTDNLELLVSWGNREEEAAIAGRSLSFGASQTWQEREVTTFDPRLVFTLDQWRLTLGSDLEDYDYALAVNSAFGLSASDHQHERRSQYLQALYSPLQSVQLSAGYRHAELDVDVDGGYFTADYDDSLNVRQLGAAWQVTDALRLRLNRDETFRFPVADENVDFLGNVVALKPQEGVAWDLGASWEWQAVAADLSLFQHTLENEIGYDTNSFANVNLDDTERLGATLDVDWQLTGQLGLGGSFTTMRAEFDGGPLSGNQVPAVAEKLAKLHLTYQPLDNLRLYAESVYTGALAVDMRAATAPIASFTVYNLAATYDLGSLRLKARLNNIFGKEYSEYVSFYGVPAYYPSPEENATLSLTYSF